MHSLFLLCIVCIIEFDEFFNRRKTRVKSSTVDRQSMRRGSVQAIPTYQKKEQEV
jgi:hypothetical protein